MTARRGRCLLLIAGAALLAALPAAARSTTTPAAAPDACLRAALGERAYAEIFVRRSRPPAAAENGKIAVCYGQSGESGTTRSGQPSATTPAAAPDACLRAALGERAYAEIFVRRSRPPAAAENGKIAA
ncbi:MAG: hypothetical protein FJW96_17740, partial [Actinobacteria bacterium]|nr:hypothetical protein [Actinomycetota bacterium]